MPPKRFHCSANLCLPFNIIPSVETFTRRADTGTNTTLLSICDLPALHPPSECNATMEKSKAEGGRLPRYSAIYWWYTSSRIADSIQRIKVWERLQIHLRDIFCAECEAFKKRIQSITQEKWRLKSVIIFFIYTQYDRPCYRLDFSGTQPTNLTFTHYYSHFGDPLIRILRKNTKNTGWANDKSNVHSYIFSPRLPFVFLHKASKLRDLEQWKNFRRWMRTEPGPKHLQEKAQQQWIMQKLFSFFPHSSNPLLPSGAVQNIWCQTLPQDGLYQWTCGQSVSVRLWLCLCKPVNSLQRLWSESVHTQTKCWIYLVTLAFIRMNMHIQSAEAHSSLLSNPVTFDTYLAG